MPPAGAGRKKGVVTHPFLQRAADPPYGRTAMSFLTDTTPGSDSGSMPW